MNDKIIFSGIQPSGRLNIGNYIGALSQWPKMQAENNCIFCVVDYHAITVKQDPEELRRRLLEITKTYLAAGIDPEKSIIFRQSDISAHTELAWILNCAGARIADLNKMTQFKDKAGKNQESVSVGLYDYPVLMAADILLYDTEIVPVGEDQKQHVELARDIAKRFNNEFGETFLIPQAVIKQEGSRIMSLLDPKKKMSKSDSNQNNCISLLDDTETARKKIMRAVTDSGSEIKYDAKKKPAISNLLVTYSLLAGISLKELEARYKGKGYGDFKKDLAETVKNFLTEFQIKYNSFSDDEVRQILKDGAEKVRPIAEEKLKKVKMKLGVN